MHSPITDLSMVQKILFAQLPSRLGLASLQKLTPTQNLTLRIHRNHAFEPLAGVLTPYLAYAGFAVSYQYSDYDDALNFRCDAKADVEIIWLDTAPHSKELDLKAWLTERLHTLRTLTKNPILVLVTDDFEEFALPEEVMPSGAYWADFSDIRRTLTTGFFHDRNRTFAGTRLSNHALVLLARELGCRWLPALFSTPIKGLVLDLDHTLYSGVLGEDGLHVPLSDGHKKLQETCRELKEKGMFLALCSRNDEDDVRRLFHTRQDFPLKFSDFSTHYINWNEKSANIINIAKDLRISTDSLLFVDDNMGELLAAHAALPGLHMIHAGDNPSETARAVAYHPGVWKWKYSATDALRTEDLKQNAERERIQATAISAEAYFQQLGTQLDFFVNPTGQTARMAELSRKTNQFNLAFKRYTEQDMEQILQDAKYCVVTFAMKDKLSDSGIIGMLVAHLEGASIIVDELCISCRALGRRLEDYMIMQAAQLALYQLNAKGAMMAYAKGERNQPALAWLEKTTHETPLAEGCVRIPVAIPQVESIKTTVFGKAPL